MACASPMTDLRSRMENRLKRSSNTMRNQILAALAALSATAIAALPSEITVKLRMNDTEYVTGERIRCVVDIANASADFIDVGSKGSDDKLVIELYRSSDNMRYQKLSKHPFVRPFTLHSGEGQRMEACLGDHFRMDEATRYLARAVLVHAGMRFESSTKSFAVVPGLNCGGALQMFKNRPNLKREFELVHWGRDQTEHLFLKVKDTGSTNRRWTTADLGTFIRVTDPKLSVLPSGEVITLHRATQDAFIRTEFWSLPEVFEFQTHEQMLDPDVAATARVKELYQDTGGVAPVKKAWWKFW